ncbi:MAG: methyltransferase domain-containing protein [SAR324 cluster bacterium]|nr:methyltransferase domain-containing protein [SAR324 cluster bacterium]
MDKARIGAFAERVFGDIAGFMTIGMAYLGAKTGLFRAMAGKGPLTISQVADLSRLQPRYVEEWLKGLVTTGYIEYEPESETFTLPDEHAYLLASEGTDHFIGGLFYQAVGMNAVAPQVAEAFRNGGGVPFDAFGEDFLIGLDLANQGMYEQRFVSYWLQTLPAVVAKLEEGGSALDVGCGAGRVSMALARDFPKARCVGLDLDAVSIEQARRAATEAGLAERVEFVHGPLAGLDTGERYDLITCCDCVHEFAEPVETLRQIRERLADDGTLFVIEPRVADRLEDNCNPIATMFYGFSTFH